MNNLTENDCLPEMIDHQHLQMWKWLHNNSTSKFRQAETSETSKESSSFSNSFDISAEMSRSIDSSSSRILSSPIGNLVTPSTSFASNNYQDLYSMTFPYFQSNPTILSNSDHFRHTSQLLLLHNMSNNLNETTVEDCDVDVVGLVDTTKEVSLNDKDETLNVNEDIETTISFNKTLSELISISTDIDHSPLDLSSKNALSPTSSSSSLSTPILRPTVIIGNHVPSTTKKNHTSVRRSMSSVTTSTHDEVAAHFRRSLSGKWPKRNKIEDSRNSPLRRRPSFNTHSSISSISPTPPSMTSPTITTNSIISSNASTILVKNHCSDTSLSVADHFRRALSGKKGFLQWK